jgi:hypothetical protein
VSSHPLSRSPTGFMQSQSFPAPHRTSAGHYTSPLTLAGTGLAIGGYAQPASAIIKCAACQRSPTSTLAASKFKRCILCKASACAVCVRTCSQQGGCKGVVCSKCAVEYVWSRQQSVQSILILLVSLERSPQGLAKCHACLSRDSSSDSSTDSVGSSSKEGIEQDACMNSDVKLDNWHINDYDFSSAN